MAKSVRRPAGEFDQRVSLQRLKSSLAVNEAGHIVETNADNWETYAKRWCAVAYRQGNEPQVGDQRVARRYPVLTFMSDSVTRGMIPGDRIVLGTRVFSFDEPPRDVKERRGEVEVACVEVS